MEHDILCPNCGSPYELHIFKKSVYKGKENYCDNCIIDLMDNDLVSTKTE